MSKVKKLITEIHKRSLWQILLVYLGVSWGLLEAAALFRDEFGLPRWLVSAALALLIAGLVVVLVLAFVPEPAASPEDPRAVQRTDPGRRHLLTWRRAATIFVVALAAWGVVATGWYLLADRARPELTESAEEARKSLAVLPFDNLSPDPENEYFADGIHDEIIAHLSLIADLKVISRTSVMEYKGRSENLRAIAESLGVTNILEGTVRRADGRVRITTQLLDALADEHLWTQIYDRDLNDVFAVQSDVAQQVATALRAKLTPAEKGRIEERPTENLEAYEYYLRGNEYFNRSWREEDNRIAEQMYEAAVELDPGFAQAYAKLSETHSRMYFLTYDPIEERLTKARETAEKALQLDPDLPEAHLALGYYHYHGRREHDRALEEFAIAQSSQPNNADLLRAIGLVLRRQGKWEQALTNISRASDLDPRSTLKALDVAITHINMRNYAEVERYCDRAISLAPDLPDAYLFKMWLYVVWQGSAENARAVYRDALERIGPEELTSRPAGPPGMGGAALRIIGGEYAENFLRLPVGSLGDSAYYFLLRAAVHGARGERELEYADYDSARVFSEAAVEEGRAGDLVYMQLGRAYAGLGRKQEAIRAGQRAVDALPVSRDALWGPGMIANLAMIYVAVGEHDAAMDGIEYLLSIPSDMSIPLLQADPIWAPLRDHQRFQALVAKYE